MPGLYFPITADSSQFNSEVNKAKAAVRQMARDIESEGKSIDSVFTRMQNAAQAALAGFGLGGFVRQMVEVRSEFQKTEIAFKTMLDSEEKAASLMNQLISTAATTPFGVSDITESAKQLLAYNTAAEEVNDTIIKLGDIAAGMSMPIKDLVFLYGTTIAKGKMDTMDLRQFLNRGIPIAQELAKVMGLDVNNAINEVGEAIKKGAVDADIFQKAIMNLASTKFGGLMEAQSKTFAGQISNIEDQIEQMFNEMGKASEGAVNTALEGVTFLVDHWREVGKIILTVVSAYGTYKAAAIAVAAVEKAKQNVTSAEINKNLDAEIANLKQELLAKNEVRQASLEEMLASKELSSAQAEEIAGKQALIEKLRQELALRQESATTRIVSASTGASDEVKEQQELADAYQERAEAIAEMAQSAEENISSQDAQTVAEQAQALATEASAAATEMETVAQTANTLQTNANTTADETNTLATNANTLSTEGQIVAFRAATAATGQFSIAKLADAAKTKVATVAQRLYQGAVVATTNAMNGLKAAFMSNPIGLILGALTTAIGLFYTFNDEVDEAAEASKKFGDACSKASADAKSLYGVINTAPKGSKVYKDALKELTDTAKEYGVTIDEEGDKLVQLNKVREEVIAKINEEAAAREHANGIQSATDAYNTNYEDSFTEFGEKFKDLGLDSAFANAFKNIIPQDAIDRMAEYRRELERIDKSEMSVAEKTHAKNEVQRSMGATYSEVYSVLKKYLEEAGVEEEQIKKLLQPTSNLVDALTDGKVAYQDSTNAVNKAAEAYAKVSAQTSLAALEQEEIANNFGFASEMAGRVGKSVQDLTADIAALMGNYSENFIQFTIGLTAQVDESTMQLLNSLGLQDLSKFAKQAMANATKLRDLQKAAKEQGKNIRYLIRDSKGIARDADYWARAAGAATSVADKQTDKEKPKATAPNKPKKKSGKSDAQKQAEEEAKERQKAFELQRRQEEEQAEQLEAARDAQERARIAQIKNAGARERAQAKYEHEKDLRDIDAQEREYRKKNYEADKEKWELTNKDKKKVYSDTKQGQRKYDEVALTKEQLDEITALRAEKNAEWEQMEAERLKTEASALDNFLKEYGSYEQKRLAIAREYSRLIDDARTVGERLSLSAQQDEAYKSLDFEKFKKSINWEAVFSELDGVSLEHLNTLRDQLRKTISDGALSATDYKTVVEQISKVEDAIVAKQNEWKNVLGLTIPELEKRKRLEQEAADAKQRVVDLQKQEEEAQKRVNSAITAIQVATGFKIDASEIKVENVDQLLEKFTPDTAIYETLVRLFGNLDKAQRDLTETSDSLGQAEGDAAIKTDKAAKTLTSAIAAINEIAEKVNANIQSTVDLIDTLGLGDTSFGKGVGEFAAAAQSASDAFADLQSGNYIGAINGIVSSVGSLGQALGAFGLAGFGDSDKTLERDIERLTGSNEALRNSIDDLTDELSEGAVADAGAIYKEMQGNLEQSVKNTQEMMRRTGAAYNNGFLGVGGRGSSNAKVDEGMSASDWQRVSKAAGTAINSASGFWSLTSEQMAKVAKDAPEMYAKIKSLADDGYKDAAQYMDDYIGYWKQLQEAEDAYFEKLTSTSLDSIVSDFSSALADMDSDASDFADKFEEYMRNAVINALVADQFKPMIEDWYKAFAKAVETDGIDQAEQEALKKQWDNITQAGLEMRDQLREQFGWGSTGEGSGAYSAAKSFSQEQGDELNGRLAAIQIGQERNNQSLVLAISTLQGLSVVTSSNQKTLDEVRNLVLIGNGHLEDIARYTKIASQYGAQLDIIVEKVKTL